jgi:hypothetical protein
MDELCAVNERELDIIYKPSKRAGELHKVGGLFTVTGLMNGIRTSVVNHETTLLHILTNSYPFPIAIRWILLYSSFPYLSLLSQTFAPVGGSTFMRRELLPDWHISKQVPNPDRFIFICSCSAVLRSPLPIIFICVLPKQACTYQTDPTIMAAIAATMTACM